MFDVEVTLERLIELLDQAPVIAEIHPVSICYLSQVRVTTLNKFIQELDSPKPSTPSRVLIVDSGSDERFTRVRVNHDPFTPELNKIIFDRFDEISEKMLKQSDISKIVGSKTGSQVIVLYLVDGLSYWDVKKNPPEFGKIEPCLVDCPTLTHVAFPNIIGDPPLAEILFDKGYSHRLGFSYWTREDNILTDRIFRIFPTVHKVGDFVEIIKILRYKLRPNTFIQIVREGFDSFSHKQKRKPPVDAVLYQIYQELRQLIEICEHLQLSARIYLTSDHGILWRDEFEPQIIGDCGKCSPRYYKGNELSSAGKLFIIDGEEYYCLEYPKLRRPLRIDEQGVHGGVSFQESIVPFIEIEVVENA